MFLVYLLAQKSIIPPQQSLERQYDHAEPRLQPASRDRSTRSFKITRPLPALRSDTPELQAGWDGHVDFLRMIVTRQR